MIGAKATDTALMLVDDVVDKPAPSSCDAITANALVQRREPLHGTYGAEVVAVYQEGEEPAQ